MIEQAWRMRKVFMLDHCQNKIDFSLTMIQQA